MMRETRTRKETGEEREKKEIYIYILYIQNYIVDTEW